MSNIVRLELQDGLLLGSGFVARADYTCILYLRVPDSWLSGEGLLPPQKEAVLEHLYGKTWRDGNEDGSRYVVLESRETILDAHAVATRIWLTHDRTDRSNKYWFYHVSEGGSTGGQFQSRTQTDFGHA